jgi:short-subunit dehydrogenase
VASAGGSVYSATKFGLRGFASGLREDLHGTGVGVTTVFPGFIRDAGMFAESGARPPAGVGTSTPEEVAEGVAEAVERDRAEVEVAPRIQRVLTNFAARRPDLAGRVAARSGGVNVADSVADHQTEKR